MVERATYTPSGQVGPDRRCAIRNEDTTIYDGAGTTRKEYPENHSATTKAGGVFAHALKEAGPILQETGPALLISDLSACG